MPRPPDPKSKIPQIIIKPRNIEEEKKIRGAKEIIARNPKLTMISILEPFLREHHWPPGNSQVQIVKFVGKRLVEKRKCEYPDCNKDAVCVAKTKEKTAKPKLYLCEAHKKHALENQLLKSYKPL